MRQERIRVYDKDGVRLSEEYLTDGQRDDCDAEAARRLWVSRGPTCSPQLVLEEHYSRGLVVDLQEWTAQGRLIREEHWAVRDGGNVGVPRDLPDGTAAMRTWHDNGVLASEAHCWEGYYADLEDGTAAVREWDTNGVLVREQHWELGPPRLQNNLIVSQLEEES